MFQLGLVVKIQEGSQGPFLRQGRRDGRVSEGNEHSSKTARETAS